MNKIILIILSLFTFLANAEDVQVVVEPKEAIVNENFFVTFKVKTSGSEEPYISFTPAGASVLGKRSQGLSISTVVINGKFTTTKEQAVVYEMLAERSGQVYLRNIKVELGGKVIPVKEVKINVLSEARRIPDAFIEAEASKERVYIGEGIDVNYYLYFKNTISANDVKEFPKLNKFIKRFHHINSPVETVQYKGQVLKRILAYSARLYPEKVGPAVLDPMKISVQVYETDYTGFGFGSQRYRTKDLSSARIEIEVLPLPTEGVPPSFTGLIGEHDFNLSINKTKFLVNEPIEFKLEVKGKGAVENFDAPVIFSDPNFEQFDTKSDVVELGTQAAKKTFEYTLLARGPVNLASRELSLAYFDPNTSRYIEKKVVIPGIEVSGVAPATTEAGSQVGQNSVEKPSEKESHFLDSLLNQDKKITKNQIGLVGPMFKAQQGWFDKGILVLNWILVSLIILILTQWLLSMMKPSSTKTLALQIKQDIRKLKKNGLSYSELYRVLSHLDKSNKMSSGGISIITIIEESLLRPETKEYFKNALRSTEGGSFGQGKNSGIKNINFEKKIL